MKNDKLSLEQKRVIITLLQKNTQLQNWHPISLLNTDYKLMAKLLANRLNVLLPSINKQWYLKSRFIGQYIRLLEDVSFFTKMKKMPCIILFIDFEKAFDSLNWNFLFNILLRVNFGNTFISFIKTMYNDIQSASTNNGCVRIFQTQKMGQTVVSYVSLLIYFINWIFCK